MDLVTRTIEQVDDEATGAAFREYRMANRVSLRELARRCNLSATYVSSLELGMRGWTAERLDQFKAAIHRGPEAIILCPTEK